MKKTDLVVDWATHKAAAYACQTWHYSECIPNGSLVKIGAWEAGRFIGVVVFGRGASPFLGKKFELGQDECVELVRIALTDHAAPVSRIVALALRFLKRQSPGLRLVVSFADPAQGHHGGIYQAGNWVFSGSSAETTELFLNGKWTHVRNGHHQRTEATQTRKAQGKYRYLMPLDDAMREQVRSLSKPYPKRAKWADSGDQPERGGSIPTCTLQLPQGGDA